MILIAVRKILFYELNSVRKYTDFVYKVKTMVSLFELIRKISFLLLKLFSQKSVAVDKILYETLS